MPGEHLLPSGQKSKTENEKADIAGVRKFVLKIRICSVILFHSDQAMSYQWNMR